MKKNRTVGRKRGKAYIQKIGVAVIAMALVVAMVIGMLPSKSLAAETMSDLNTSTKYSESLGDNASTEYAGRIWSDKSVFTEDATFVGYEGHSQTVEIGEDDFLVSFSTLATSRSISGHTQAPLDVVFVIDLSGSMSNGDSNMTSSDGVTKSRIAFTVDAVNKAIEDLMKLDNARVGVVGFNETAVELLPLDRYTKSGNNKYFSLDTETGSRNLAVLYTRAVNSSNTTIRKNTNVSGGTNIQHGVYAGMNLLASANSTKATIDGKEVQRVPSVVILSDGAPTYSCEDTNWWAPQIDTDWWGNYEDGYGVQGPGGSSYYGNGMLTMMTAAYMKAAIDRNYGVTGAQATNVYTIGMGISDLVETTTDRWGNVYITDSSQRDLARVTLNPGGFLDATDNDYAEDIKDAWENYTGQARNADTTPSIAVNRSDDYTLTHPSEYDIYDAETQDYDALKYVDAHYDADDADSIADVFSDIVNSITISAPEVPTEHDTQSPLKSGYITYTDPIGEYMEVKDMKAIIYAGEKYEYDPSKTKVSGNTTTYVFDTGEVGNEVYGKHSLKEIEIQVVSEEKEDDIVSQTLTIRIPAALIPIRINTVELNADGTVKSHTNNGTYPIRVLYTVGLQDAVLTSDKKNISLEKLSADYIAANSNEDGTIDFYSNLYTGTNVVNGSTAGDATVTFTAAKTNPFYYMQEDALLYTDPQCKDGSEATGNALDLEKKYYYKETYYHGLAVEVHYIERTGAQLTGNTVVVKKADGYWYRPAGTVRVNRMLHFEGTKTLNQTATAQDFYAPTYDGVSGMFKVYLGNNGVLSVEATGTLKVSKTVEAEGLQAPNADFVFTVNLEDASGKALAGTYAYTITDKDGNGVSEGMVANDGKITLKADQTATIVNLPPGTVYTVTEGDVKGFTAYVGQEEKNVVAGTIETGKVVEEAFVNKYEVEPLTYPTSGGLSGAKVLDGRDWTASDAFTFAITSTNNAPLPDGLKADGTITITSSTAKEDEQVPIDFGKIEFTQPGVYYYTVVELPPTMTDDNRIAGVSYTKEAYEVVVTVTDNGDGTMSAHSVMTKVLDFSGLAISQTITNNVATFTNVYRANTTYSGPVATKVYTDNSGAKPLTDGMFTFEMRPTTDGAPMPQKEDGTPADGVGRDAEGVYYRTTNYAERVTFSQMAFTHEHVGKTYQYELREMIPAGATDNGNGTYTLNGMTYDGHIVIATVTVAQDATSGSVVTTWTYNTPEGAVFTNTYATTPVVLGDGTNAPIQGTKTLTGRNMNDGEFTFTLSAADAFTTQAIANQDVVCGETSATVDGATADSQKKAVDAFDFGTTTFTKPGTYTFHITEDEVNAGGVTYDTHVCTVTVVVTDNNGKLEAAVTYSDGVDGAVYNNRYMATFDLDTAINLYGTKVLTGRPLLEGQFFFVVEPQNGAPMGARATYVSALEDGSITFLENVVYTEAGTYEYKITEYIPTEKHGVTYDESVYVVKVQVTDNLQGTLSAAIVQITKNGTTIYDGTGALDKETITFANEYTAKPVEYTQLDIVKILSGERNEALQAGEFDFIRTITPSDGAELLGADGQIVSGDDVISNDANGIVKFGKIRFTKTGTYVVEIKEVLPAGLTVNANGQYVKDGIIYDTQVIRATFKVTDDLAGNLVVTRIAFTGSITFKNTYVTTGELIGSEKLNVTKVLDVTDRTGRTSWTEEDVFTFVLEAHDDETEAAIANGLIELPTETSIEIGKPNGATDKNSKAFDNITFHAVGKYAFVIREVAGTEIGMDYDATARIIEVTTTDNGDGTLTVTTSADSQINPEFKNVYNVGDVILPGHGNLHINKVFTGRANDEWLATDNFVFTLEASNDAAINGLANDKVIFAGNKELTQMSLTVTKENKNYVHFDNITFEAAGTYEFVIKEVVPVAPIPGVTYDADLDRTVTIEVTEKTRTVQGNEEKYLLAEIDYDSSDEDAGNANAFTFNNTYIPDEVPLDMDIQTNLGVEKVIAGRKWMSGDAFSFTLAAGDEVTEKGLAEDTIVFADKDATTMTLTVTNADKAWFDDITFHKAGVFAFVITEDGTDTANMKYDKHSATILVTVEDNMDEGKLVITKTEVIGAMTWTNTYTPNSVTQSLTAVKKIDGRGMLESDIFAFTIVAANDTARTAMPETTRVLNAVPVNDQAAISFGPITYTEAGTYEYILYENTVSKPGIAFDTGYVSAKVVVTYDDNTGLLSVGEPEYEKVNSKGTGNEFINTYTTTGILYGSKDLKVTKHFTGRANDAWLEGDTFTFTLEAYGDKTKLAVEDREVVLPTDKKITISFADSHKEKAFGNIIFTEEGTYEFLIKEVVPAGGVKDGIEYDSDYERIISVTTKDNADGTMTVTVGSNSESLVFENKYLPDDAVLEGATNLEVEKRIRGREWITKDTYSFTLEADISHTSTAQAITNGLITMPNADDCEVTITDETPDYKAHFGNIVFSKPGTYKFIVTEENGLIPGVRYDVTPRSITVAVTDNHDGTMSATVVADNSDSLVFINVYSAASTTAEIEGTKKLNGRALDAADDFRFTISIGDGSETDTPLPVEETVKQENGKIQFAPITFKKAGTYKYVIDETIGNSVKGVTEVTPNVVVTVTVADDTENGKLKVTSIVYSSPDASDAGKFVYENTYTTAQTDDVKLIAKKKVTPEIQGNTYKMVGGEFKFIVDPADGNAIYNDPIGKLPITVSNDKDGNIVLLNNVAYTEAGTYEYTVQEANAEKANCFEYDNAVYTVIVKVTDDPATAKLSAAVTIQDKAGKTVDSIAFNNIYKPGTTSAIISGTKELKVTGSDKQLESKEFEFKLIAIDGAPMPSGATNAELKTKNTNDVFTFDTITYTVPGTFKYKVTEVVDSSKEDYIKYDKTEHIVTIKVEDVNGQLTVVENSMTTSPVKFVNEYIPVKVTLEGSTALKGLKKITGRDLKKEEFTFQLFDENNNEVLTAKNDKDGNFKFEPLTFTKEDTYYYTIKEKNEGLGGVTYDGNSYVVKIVVEDQNGYLEADVTYISDATNQEAAVVFNNSYKANGTSITFEAEKTLSGRKLRNGEFSFRLMDKSGTEIETVSNDEYGNISFSEIVYTEVGKHEYKIAEVKGEHDYITYDDNVYEITVEITDDYQGQLQKTVLINDKNGAATEVLFGNEYKPADAKVTLSGKKILNGRTLKADEFVFVLKNEIGDTIETVKNTKKGTFAFTELVFTQPGTFIYTVTEDDTAKEIGITYDKAVYTVTITVTDDGEGKLVPEIVCDKDGQKAENIVFTNKYTYPKIMFIKTQQINDGDAVKAVQKVEADDIITYYITVSNNGTELAKEIVITDTIAKDLLFVEGSASEGAEVKNGVITWKIDVLQPDEEVMVSFKVKVPKMSEAAKWSNIAYMTYENDPENPDKPYETNEVTVEMEKDAPKTGDDSSVATWMTVLMASVMVGGVLLVVERKRRTR